MAQPCRSLALALACLADGRLVSAGLDPHAFVWPAGGSGGEDPGGGGERLELGAGSLCLCSLAGGAFARGAGDGAVGVVHAGGGAAMLRAAALASLAGGHAGMAVRAVCCVGGGGGGAPFVASAGNDGRVCVWRAQGR